MKREDLGAAIGHNRMRWYPFGQPWTGQCPIDDCEGTMVPTGWSWPTGDPGIHHNCDTCGIGFAVRESQVGGDRE